MTSSPSTSAPFSRPASAPGRDLSSRSRASTSAGPAPGSRISSTTHSPDTATSPPSVSTAMTGTSMPVLPSRRQRLRAATRSVRASTRTASCGPASSSAATSGAAVRTPCGSSVSAGRTDPGSGSAVSSSSSTSCLLFHAGRAGRATPVDRLDGGRRRRTVHIGVTWPKPPDAFQQNNQRTRQMQDLRGAAHSGDPTYARNSSVAEPCRGGGHRACRRLVPCPTGPSRPVRARAPSPPCGSSAPSPHWSCSPPPRSPSTTAPLSQMLDGGPRTVTVREVEGTARIGAPDVERLIREASDVPVDKLYIDGIDADGLERAVDDGADPALLALDPATAVRFGGTVDVLGKKQPVSIISEMQL